MNSYYGREEKSDVLNVSVLTMRERTGGRETGRKGLGERRKGVGERRNGVVERRKGVGERRGRVG
jgi:hypothetical protein